MRIISLSVDGIHQAAERGLYDWLAKQDADIICLQDLRALEHELDGESFQLDGYLAYFFDSGVKHCNGVAIYTRHQPKALIFGLGFNSGEDMRGRYLQADFEHISVGSLLTPSAYLEPQSQEMKDQFFKDLQHHLYKITRKRRDFIFCGNWNMAHKRCDLQHGQDNMNLSGFLPHEQLWMDQLIGQLGYHDAFRIANQDQDEFSWWPEGGVGKGDGWRTDLHIISDNLRHNVEYGAIYKNQSFSSHLPVMIDYDIEPQQL